MSLMGPGTLRVIGALALLLLVAGALFSVFAGGLSVAVVLLTAWLVEHWVQLFGGNGVTIGPLHLMQSIGHAATGS
ncbi:hypothetical protein KM176_21280 [Pseudooceanicola sp. CBS1P-1]|uniref:Uncharacterized protein n=1 Tax=Pseudooceanicola albus TaxID=2692189 RepID=A0A6L7GA68_9RHOB|nr:MULTISPECIES: hypothetical protein [Pseudooceanicola]MBT9386414.1 hypothetical protein [Pseudooceanicola endophyticus]MXN20428.1 hypothetical protein [Pseudooceanicola albus]